MGLPPPKPLGPGDQIYTTSFWGTMTLPYALAGQALQQKTTGQRRKNNQPQDIQGQEGGQECLWNISLKITMEQRPKVVRDIVLTCVVLHNKLRSHQGGADKPLTPADDIQPSQNDKGEQGQNENFRELDNFQPL